MTSEELNLKLRSSIPEITESYQEETSWQDGDKTGSHIIYADVFVPYIKEQILQNNEENLTKIFNFIECLLDLQDEYVDEVIALSVIESLIWDDEIKLVSFVRFLKNSKVYLLLNIETT